MDRFVSTSGDLSKVIRCNKLQCYANMYVIQQFTVEVPIRTVRNPTHRACSI